MSEGAILVVENRRRFSDLLRKKGHIVTTARDGDGALAMLATDAPRLLLLDMTTPQLDTVRMCERARRILGDSVPIILIAPSDDPGTLHTALKGGATDYFLNVEKPEIIAERVVQLALGPERTAPAVRDGVAQALKNTGAPKDIFVPAVEEPEPIVAADPPPKRRSAGRAAARTAARRPTAQPMQVTAVKWAAIVVGCLWLMGAGYQEFLKPDPMQTIRSAQMKRQVGNCRGTYSSRYKCQSSLMIASESKLFGLWTRKIGVVFIPLLMLSVLYHSVFLRIWGRR